MWDSSWSEDFISFFNNLFARICIYFAKICEGSKKSPQLWINVVHLHDAEEMGDSHDSFNLCSQGENEELVFYM